MDFKDAADAHGQTRLISARDRTEHGELLLSGATGFLGMEVLAQHLQSSDRHVHTLVRAGSEREAKRRMAAVLERLFGPDHPYTPRVSVVRADLTRSGLGLRRARRVALAERVGEIVHAAADVSFRMDLKSARTINLEGTRRMIELAELCSAHGGLRRFSHVSTAYIAGDHRGYFSEDDLDVGQSFRNAYEQSKFETEQMLSGWRGRLPITVLRPSIIVGERRGGWTSSFNVLYWPLRAFSSGTYLVLPARSSAPVDVVPVDYVAEAILALTDAPEAEGSTFHLSAGKHTSSVGELAQLASSFFGLPAPRMLDPRLYHSVLHPLLMRAAREERTRRALERSEIFFPYFDARATFDDRRSRVALAAAGIAPSPLASYFDRLMEFALAAEWGRIEQPRYGGLGRVTQLPRRPARARELRPELALAQ